MNTKPTPTHKRDRKLARRDARRKIPPMPPAPPQNPCTTYKHRKNRFRSHAHAHKRRLEQIREAIGGQKPPPLRRSTAAAADARSGFAGGDRRDFEKAMVWWEICDLVGGLGWKFRSQGRRRGRRRKAERRKGKATRRVGEERESSSGS